MKHLNKFTYYILSLTWGLPMTLLGLILSAILLLLGYRPKRYGWTFYFEVGNNWGGVELGLTFVCSEPVSEHVKAHEFGHSIQNCYLGPLMPFVISIPSAIRYWYREVLMKCGKKDLPPYDSIWFEGHATKIGTFYRDKYFNNK